jgi:hypothetical protein
MLDDFGERKNNAFVVIIAITNRLSKLYVPNKELFFTTNPTRIENEK